MKRLDIAVFERGLSKSREAGRELIKNGAVTVDGTVIFKPSHNISDDAEISVTTEESFVGRGGLKLEKALNSFGIDVCGSVCLDIGASTGGFTDCLLKRGAKKVYALDVGHGQLAEELCEDDRVVNLEGTNIRTIPKDFFEEKINFICIDVSFVSLKQVLPKASEILCDGGKLVALIKPQFEAGKANLNKNGIVKSPKVHKAVIADIADFSGGMLAVKGIDFSPVARKDGNIEYLIFLENDGISEVIDFGNIVEKAHREVLFDR